MGVRYEKEKEYLVSYCGSYCHTCDWHTGRIRKISRAALDMMKLYGGFRKQLEGKADPEEITRGLEVLSESGICSGCKAELEKDPETDRCAIRQCCAAKGLLLCSECPDFPCEMLATNPGVIRFGCLENLRQIGERGIERWIDEQWEKETGTSPGLGI
ncbi:hypothetical protein AMJ71_10835 [candidate division TA06 bacterium SM1_40]|uniref:GON domain-containing protein n=1 Tax=candidate division TA06 bacterium SM1_40 TaxID=1703773 RepID=A0A0S8J7V4_UNCT6|nr:MAG: hypothetical protein AMJ71_10835 [candidate division TA06 bacterium SM1_40]